MNRNKVLTIVAIAIVALIAAFGVWYYFSLSNGGIGGGNSSNGGLGGVSFPLESKGSVSTSSPLGINGSSTSPEAIVAPVPRLRHIAVVPVAGAGFNDRTIQVSTTSTSTVNGKVVTRTVKTSYNRTFISYLQRADSHIYETATDTLFTARLSNTTIPKIYQANFVQGNSIVMRYLDSDYDTVQSFLATLSKKPVAATSTVLAASSTASTTLIVTSGISLQATTSAAIIASEIDSQQLQGNFLPEDLRTFAISPAKDKVFYLVEDFAGSSGVIKNFSSAKTSTVFRSPFRQWVADWASINSIFMTTAPSANASGYLYLLNQSTGATTKLLGPLTGLETLGNTNGSKVLYSTTNGGGVALSIYALKDKSSATLSLKTLPDKCVWSTVNTDLVYCAVPNTIPNNQYPDAWNQGLVSFGDSFWSINTSTGQTTLLINPEAQGISIDALNLQLDSSEGTLMFMNKSDLTLWDYRLKEPVPAVSSSALTSTSATATTPTSAVR